MTTRPPRRGRRRRAPAERGGVGEFWATVLRRFRDHLHAPRPVHDDREDRR
ncbi:hypothetical protein [Pseudonocardia lacus]|uniref:hypothetical protein n=1 Tax=Pseudonocardia lacus TaxID=2835865 RepID=UPI001BDBE7F3|nr:hypothetical protein [Pseudonocardia lacus]